MIVLTRGQISKIKNRKSHYVDVTVKSASETLKPLAPTWNMVMGAKKSKLSKAEYTEMYLKILDKVTENTWKEVEKLGRIGKLKFLCYCPDGVFCHTHLLINYMLTRWPNIYSDGRQMPC